MPKLGFGSGKALHSGEPACKMNDAVFLHLWVEAIRL